MELDRSLAEEECSRGEESVACWPSRVRFSKIIGCFFWVVNNASGISLCTCKSSFYLHHTDLQRLRVNRMYTGILDMVTILYQVYAH